MKCIILIVATIASVLSASSASSYHHKVEKAHSEVMSYVAENMGGIRMMRSNKVHLECYNGFLPLINSLAVAAKNKSNVCVTQAENDKHEALSGLDRTQVAAEVKKITDSLADCSKKEGLDYFMCLESNAETNRQLMETVRNMAKQVLSDKESVVATIDSNEQLCIMNAVDAAKNESDAAFTKLKACIVGEATFDDVAEPTN